MLDHLEWAQPFVEQLVCCQRRQYTYETCCRQKSLIPHLECWPWHAQLAHNINIDGLLGCPTSFRKNGVLPLVWSPCIIKGKLTMCLKAYTHNTCSLGRTTRTRQQHKLVSHAACCTQHGIVCVHQSDCVDNSYSTYCIARYLGAWLHFSALHCHCYCTVRPLLVAYKHPVTHRGPKTQ